MEWTNMKVVIIDSGANEAHKAFKSGLNIISAVHIYKDSTGRYAIDQKIEDRLGHGTGVCWIINKYICNAEYIIIKLFDQDEEVDEDLLLFSLNYIKKNITCNVINISAGIARCGNRSALEQVCNDLVGMGVTIVAAFANDGALSYPAAFKNVIGVDISLSCFSPKEFQFIENSPVTVRGMGYPQLLPSVGDRYQEQRGASFATPVITGLLCKALRNDLSPQKALIYLQENASCIVKGIETGRPEPLHIRSANIFPLNKETLALAEHADMLSFQIKHIFDLKYSGNIGKKLSAIVYPGCRLCDSVENLVIESIDDVDWSDETDTMIIGHINMVSKALRHSNLKTALLQKCRESQKQVYLYDAVDCPTDILINCKKERIRMPSVTKKDVPKNRYGKLHQVSSPVLGIFGTSPKQGKFTLQLNLRQYMQKAGYQVASLGTEPEAELFGFEGVYPMGYNSAVEISGEQAVLYINYLMSEIDYQSPDLIIVGSQSQTIATGSESIGFMAISQHELILGSQPDAYVLCVNTTDELEYIERTIRFLTSVTSARVISFAVFPLIYKNEEGFLTNVLGRAEDFRIQQFIGKLENVFGIHAYSMDDPKLLENLKSEIITFFS